MAEIDNGKEDFCFTCPLESICVDNGKAPPCAKLVVEKITAPNSESAPLICDCGDHITGDYAFVDGKYLCPVCMEW